MSAQQVTRPGGEGDARGGAGAAPRVKIGVRDLNFFYGRSQALFNVTLDIPEHGVTAFIGPSGCGKSTVLRTLNRMNDVILGTRVEGQVLIDGQNIYAPGTDVVQLRRKVGMVFQKSTPFPKSIYENVAYGLRINRLASGRADTEERVNKALVGRRAVERGQGPFEGERDGPFGRAAAAPVHRPRARRRARRDLMDEPASALDPMATQKIEELIVELKNRYTIVIVTHNMQQAARVSDRTAFFWLGKLIEFSSTDRIFTNPSEKLTEDYITGRLAERGHQLLALAWGRARRPPATRKAF
jgi:phosphate transport system ATP-binding protein